MPTESPVEREPMFASRQGTSWQRKAVCEEEELGLIQRKLRSPRTFFVFVNNFWLRSSAPPPPRDTSTKFSLCRTKSCTGGKEDVVLLPGFVVGEAGVRELFGRGDFFQDSSHCAYCC